MKELLLFMTDFYGYNEDIIAEINNQGFNVTWFLDKIYITQKDRLINKINKTYIEKKFDAYFDSCLKKVEGKKFDEILIIFGASFMKTRHIKLLRKYFPNTKIVYYAWDSVKNFPLIENLLTNSDIAFTFDSDDATKYNAKFLPLFFVNSINTVTEAKYDVSTVMSFFLEKSSSLKSILSVLPEGLKNNIYLKIRDKIYYYRMKIFNKNKITGLEQYFKYGALSRKKVYDIFCNSKVVIDCPLPNQKGLTMRTFEVLALKRKLITTNKNIMSYDFYTPDNIYVIGSGRNDINKFINTNFNEKYVIDNKYSLENFVKTLIDN